ncbi:MAG TPA: DUF5410 domain-containing protein [Rickettsia endosymbiont of Pyrocoelia pectoralis]|nr:DUF5410 domain-containing protein [Rickettsia endosymbiont of Pyrocoelia pectoralis]
MPKKPNTTDVKTLVKLVKEEVKNKKVGLEILEKLQNEFASRQRDREAFINMLDKEIKEKKITKEQLHKLNEAVMENAEELIPSNDPNFVCREAKNKVFQQLLLLEAKHLGMKAKLKGSELQPLTKKDIPQEILDHYVILAKKFYPQRDSKNSFDNRIAQSINFLLYAPLFREEEAYKKLEQKIQLQKESEVSSPAGKYVESLTKERIAESFDLKEPHHHENNANQHNEKKGKVEKLSIINDAIEKLEKTKNLIVTGNQQAAIKSSLSKLENIFYDKGLVDILHQELYKRQSKWSKFKNYIGIKTYGISKESLEKIEKIINSKTKHLPPHLPPEVRQQLAKITEEINSVGNETKPSEVKKAVKKQAANKKVSSKPKKQAELKMIHR